MKKQIFISLLLCLSLGVYSQEKTLTLYTQSACNNCKYAKAVLQKNKIAFVAFSLEEKENAIEMQRRLNKANHHAAIYLPVIFENDSVLLHPQGAHNDSTLFFTLQKIISNKTDYVSDTISQQHNRIEYTERGKTDCDFQPINKYLVCANFKDPTSAEQFKNTLIKNGYPLAGVIFLKDFYRVYATVVSETENEVMQLNNLRRQYRGAYILMPE